MIVWESFYLQFQSCLSLATSRILYQLWDFVLKRDYLLLVEAIPCVYQHGNQQPRLNRISRFREMLHLPNEITLQYDIIDVYNFSDNCERGRSSGEEVALQD